MGKRLPYFQFEPAEYLTGNIMFCSLASQGLFNQICSLYWQKDCKLTLSQALKRLNNKDLFDELISEAIIKVEDDFIIIKFLDNQYVSASKKSFNNSKNGQKGAIIRWEKEKQNSEAIANAIPNAIASLLKNDSESIALREDKIKENNINPEIEFLRNEVLAFFNFNEVANFNHLQTINDFLKIQHQNQRFDYFKNQFYAYREFIKGNEQFKMSFFSYLGKQSERFEGGKWDSENWTEKLKAKNLQMIKLNPNNYSSPLSRMAN